MGNYVVYHLHSDLSLLDSCTSYKNYVDRAKELGQKAICFTEHGNIFNWVEKKMYCEAASIKYMHGIEIYLTETLSEKVRDNYHTILIAKNFAGFKEINSLVDKSTQDNHRYFKPRISFEEFLAVSDNVIKISACLASPLNRLRNHPMLDALCRHYDYFEVQPHVHSIDQIEYNGYLASLAKQYDKPLIAGTDTHSINTYKAECRSILQKAKKIEYTDEDKYDLTYKTYDELIKMFAEQGVLDETDYMSAIQNTVIMADSVEPFTLDKSFKYPVLYDNEEAVFKRRITQKYNEKIKNGVIKPDPQYKKNMLEEMRVFKKIGMIGFMLFMSELISWCWENGIPVGPCRGSVGGSTVAYITDITDVDPVVWDTIFSRFANEDRTEIGDIDVDISPSQRQLVYDHIIETIGADYTAYILATGTAVDKGAIDEIGRALSYKWEDENPNSKEENPYSIDALKAIKKEYDADPDSTKSKYPEIFYYFDGIINSVVSQSMHPAGIIASPITLADNYGTFWSDGKRIISLNMEEVHEVSLVKYDILGLKNIEVAKDACEFAGIKYPRAHELNWNDEAVWRDMITSKVGIFQFEGDYAFSLLQRFQPKTINDISLVNAALRPSGDSYRDRLIAKEHNTNPSKPIDDLLAANNGFLVFQEDTIKFLQNICGLSGSDADNVRRAIGRKQKDRLEKALPGILEGYCRISDKPREVAEEEAKAFLQIIEDSSNYQFGLNHSTGYSMIGYICAFLRYYYPVEFVAAYLNNANSMEDIQDGTNLARLKGVDVNPIQFRHSRGKYQPDPQNHAVYKGISSIKFVGADVGDKLYAIRDMRFEAFIDFLQVNPADSRSTKILITLDFFNEFGSYGRLMGLYDLFESLYGRSQFNKDNLPCDEAIIQKYSTETAKMHKVTDMVGLIKELSDQIPDSEIPVTQRIKAEAEYLGYINYSSPKLKRYYYVLDINTRYSPRFTLYNLETGETETMKMYADQYEANPISKGDIIKVLSKKPKNKSKKIDGKWCKICDEYEDWISQFVIKGKVE